MRTSILPQVPSMSSRLYQIGNDLPYPGTGRFANDPFVRVSRLLGQEEATRILSWRNIFLQHPRPLPPGKTAANGRSSFYPPRMQTDWNNGPGNCGLHCNRITWP